MTERELRTKSNEYNAATAVTMGYQEIRNSGENWDTIQRLFAEGRAKDLNDEPKKLLQPVILTGSGPSLDDSIAKLKDWKGGIICHYSQAPTLMYYGVEPDYIVALDSICNWEGLSCNGEIDWSKTKTKLVLHPGMWPSLVKNWPNEMLFYRQNLGKPDSFGVNEQKVMFSRQVGGLEEALASKMAWEPLVKTELTMFACTPPAQLFVAQVLQYGPVFLTGMDFAYQGDRERFTSWKMIDGEWKECPAKLPERPAENPYIVTNNGLATDPLHLYYKKNFISACRLSMQRVFTTDKGAITEMPYIEMDKVIESQGKKLPEITPEKRALNYERYLASIHCFCIQFEHGNAFVEVQNPIPDITGFMMEKNRQYVCQQCGSAFTARDDNNHDGDNCPTCNKPKLRRINTCDVRANLNRIQALIDYNKETGIG